MIELEQRRGEKCFQASEAAWAKTQKWESLSLEGMVSNYVGHIEYWSIYKTVVFDTFEKVKLRP